MYFELNCLYTLYYYYIDIYWTLLYCFALQNRHSSLTTILVGNQWTTPPSHPPLKIFLLGLDVTLGTPDNITVADTMNHRATGLHVWNYCPHHRHVSLTCLVYQNQIIWSPDSSSSVFVVRNCFYMSIWAPHAQGGVSLVQTGNWTFKITRLVTFLTFSCWWSCPLQQLFEVLMWYHSA